MRVLLSASLICLALLFMSNRTGRGNVTGNGATLAPGETGQTCGQQGCHSSGSFEPEIDIQFLNSNGEAVNAYIPGESYTLRYTVNNASGNAAGFGFMMVSLDGDDQAVNAWSSTQPDNVRLLDIGDRTYIEQTTLLGGNTIDLNWDAPIGDSGAINFYAASALVNGNGSPSGDKGANLTFTFNQDTPINTKDIDRSSFTISPNPVVDRVTITGDRGDMVRMYDLTGALITSTHENNIDVSGLRAGQYFISTFKEGVLQGTKTFIKN